MTIDFAEIEPHLARFEAARSILDVWLIPDDEDATLCWIVAKLNDYVSLVRLHYRVDRLNDIAALAKAAELLSAGIDDAVSLFGPGNHPLFTTVEATDLGEEILYGDAGRLLSSPSN